MFELKITMDGSGVINVLGPVNNRALCEAMLAGARTVIEQYERRQLADGVTAAPIDLSRLRNGG